MDVKKIQEYIEIVFTLSTIDKAKQLLLNSAIPSMDLESDFITASVLDRSKLLVVEFHFANTFGGIRIEGYCSCYKEDCKHQAAVLLEAIQALELEQLTDHPAPKFKLKKAPSNHFRLLPLEQDFASAVIRYAPKKFKHLSNWAETFEGRFISPSVIELINVSKRQYNYGFEKQKIQLKVEGDQVYIKCLTCAKKIDTLCLHQTNLLFLSSKVFNKHDILRPNAYEEIVEKGCEELSIARSALDSYFEMKITSDGVAFIATKENMVDKKWLADTQKLQSNAKETRDEFINKEMARLNEGRAQKYAFFWSNEEAHSKLPDLNLFFAKGSAYKNKEGIRDVVKQLETIPTDFPTHLQELGQQFFFHSQKEDLETQFQLMRDLIENNVEILNEIYHYTYKGNLRSHYTPKVSELNLVKFLDKPLECEITFEVIDGFTHLTRHLTHDGEPFNFRRVNYINPVFSSTSNFAYLNPHHRFQEFMEIFPENFDTIILPVMDKVQQTNLVNQFQNNFEVTFPDDLVLEEKTLTNPEFQILLREAGEFIIFEPRLKYDGHSFNAFEEEDNFYIEDFIFKVDEMDRTYLVDFLKNAHPDFNKKIQIQDYVFIPVNELINNYWFIHFNEACEAAGILVLGQKDLSKFKYSSHRAKTQIHLKSGIDWFDVEASVSFGKEKIKTADWIRALRNKESFIKLKDGSLGMLPEEWLKQASQILAVADLEKGNLKISKYRFNVIEDLFENIDDKKVIKELKDKKARLLKIDTNKKYTLPDNINATLRDYQKHGFEWLKFLDESEFGGILADDMGLGKTLQVITLLADQIKAAPSLVIVPRSLLFNWAAELDKFCPDLKYVIHHGPSRTKIFEELKDKNIIITTYSTAAIDIQMFKDFKFNYIILDESQAIKNPNSKRYKAMRLLQSRNRLAMTGTPIENNTFDLYAQLSFTSPGLLGGVTSFKNNFSIPIDTHGDTDAANLLRKLIHPFILRRTKEQVAKDLPEKTETIIYCEMGSAQRKLYDNLKRKIKEDIEEVVEEKGVAKSKFQMLDGLLRLRQMCNSPLLVNPSFTGVNAESVKINMLMENLTEAIDQKHNALVFSQFTSLLAIVKKELDKRGIKYAYLDGSTTNRQAQVNKFMNDDEISVFLISIKAGNTGMNLTKADYVYIIDPWWNPAVEAQAIDRTHRIGQKSQIFAYKLICKNSIEEKIIKLQAKKKQLATDIIRTDENVLKSLKKDELMALFD